MGKYTLPEMPYAYDALEPHIDARTMEIHHTKHHQKYTDGMNGALEKLSPELQSKDIVDILSSINDVSDDVRGAINFNGGGYDNHKLFWNNMKPNGGGEPGGALQTQLMLPLDPLPTLKSSFLVKQLLYREVVGVGLYTIHLQAKLSTKQCQIRQVLELKD